MLKRLESILPMLGPMISRGEGWESILINRREPVTYRLLMHTDDGLRICLHKFLPCEEKHAFAHPHRWPGAFAVLQGSYAMKVARAPSKNKPPDSYFYCKLSAGSRYEMVDPLIYHAVQPLEVCYSVMINGAPYPAGKVHKKAPTTKGKGLQAIPGPQLEEMRRTFLELLI